MPKLACSDLKRVIFEEGKYHPGRYGHTVDYIRITGVLTGLGNILLTPSSFRHKTRSCYLYRQVI